MSQRLKIIAKKNGTPKNVGVVLHNGSKNNLSIIDIFKNVFFGTPIKNKVTNGKSKNKIRSYFNGEI